MKHFMISRKNLFVISTPCVKLICGDKIDILREINCQEVNYSDLI